MELTDNEKDKTLWRIAETRAAFKINLVSYFITNSFLWCIWYFTTGWGSYPWPLWPMLGWGIGLIFHYFKAYYLDKADMVTKEYEKLKKEREKQST